MTVTVIVQVAYFAQSVALLAFVVDRIHDILKNIPKSRERLNLVDCIVFIAAEPFIVQFLHLHSGQLSAISRVLLVTLSDHPANPIHIDILFVSPFLFDRLKPLFELRLFLRFPRLVLLFFCTSLR